MGNENQSLNTLDDILIEKELLEPELRPEYINKIEKIKQKNKFKKYKSLSDLRKEIENA